MFNYLGVKHLIECHCTLKIYQGSDNHLYHKFPVYSKFDEKGKVIEKIVSCNHCDTLHKVEDICKSSIIPGGKDENRSAVSIEDIQLQISDKINKVLNKYQADLATWEECLDIVENSAWGSRVIISREFIDQKYHIKSLEIIDENKIKIHTNIIQDEINLR